LLYALILVLLTCCATGNAEAVQISGDPYDANLVLRYIRAAEAGDAPAFQKMTARSVEPKYGPPPIADVDRADEGCALRSLESNLRMVSAVWRCPDDTKTNVQRTFLIEGGRVTYMWNDWGSGPL